MQEQVREVRVEHEVREYIVSLVAATRQHQHVYLGASPRGSLALFHASQAFAALRGRDFVQPDDVKSLVKPHSAIASSLRRRRVCVVQLLLLCWMKYLGWCLYLGARDPITEGDSICVPGNLPC